MFFERLFSPPLSLFSPFLLLNLLLELLLRQPLPLHFGPPPLLLLFNQPILLTFLFQLFLLLGDFYIELLLKNQTLLKNNI